MSYLPFTVLAFLLNAASVTVDKFLLIKTFPNPLVYIFYISLFSLLALLLLPFTNTPTPLVLTLASASTLLWTVGAYLMFKTLKIGLISRVIPSIGTLTALFLLIYAFQTSTISLNETWAAGFLILGLIFLTFGQWRGKVALEEIILEVLSAAFFAVSYLILRQAYLEADFLSVLVYSRFILIPLGLLLLFIPKIKKQILPQKQRLKISSSSLLFGFGQASGGISQLLLTFSISLASPALVNSLQGTQYVFLLIFGIVLFKEKYSKIILFGKILGIAAVALGLYILASSSAIPNEITFGVTYSPKYAHSLGLEPMTTYISLLDELKIKRIRLPIYWDEVEQFPNKFNFSINDFYLNEAMRRDVKLILVLGYKQPRWPECFAPVWVKNLTRDERRSRILDFVQKEVEYFKKFPNIIAWQIENEPFLSYGVCDRVTDETYKLVGEEVEIVQKVDPRPILITDSGELGLWTNAIKRSDTFGTTLYRQIWSRYLGSQTFPLPPFFYSFKNQLVRELSRLAVALGEPRFQREAPARLDARLAKRAGKQGETIISELQAEPWLTERQDPTENTLAEQASLMSVSNLKNNINYALETNFSQIYLWGVEWWYFMAKNSHPEYLEFAKTLFH